MKCYLFVVMATLLLISSVSYGYKNNGYAISSENMASDINLIPIQALELGNLHEKVMNYTISITMESDSNLTKMNQVALEKLVEKKLMTEYEKNKLSHYIIGLTQNNSKIRNNLTDTRNQVSTLLTDFFKYNASIASIGLASILNNSLTFNSNFVNNTLIDLHVTDTSDVIALDVFCGALGGATFGTFGMALGAGFCSAQELDHLYHG